MSEFHTISRAFSVSKFSNRLGLSDAWWVPWNVPRPVAVAKSPCWWSLIAHFFIIACLYHHCSSHYLYSNFCDLKMKFETICTILFLFFGHTSAASDKVNAVRKTVDPFAKHRELSSIWSTFLSTFMFLSNVNIILLWRFRLKQVSFPFFRFNSPSRPSEPFHGGRRYRYY
jgi:hypothetical protein